MYEPSSLPFPHHLLPSFSLFFSFLFLSLSLFFSLLLLQLIFAASPSVFSLSTLSGDGKSVYIFIYVFMGFFFCPHI